MQDPTGRLAPILVVPDVPRSVELYERVFGFRRLDYVAGNDDYVPLERDGAELHVMTGATANPNHTHAAHVADVVLGVQDLDRVVSAAQDAGLAITRGPERYDSTPMATTEVVVEDHDGYWFCCALAHPS